MQILFELVVPQRVVLYIKGSLENWKSDRRASEEKTVSEFLCEKLYLIHFSLGPCETGIDDGVYNFPSSSQVYSFARYKMFRARL